MLGITINAPDFGIFRQQFIIIFLCAFLSNFDFRILDVGDDLVVFAFETF